MNLFQNIKALVNKEGYDFEGNVTLQNFHPQIEIFFAIKGIFFNNRDSKKRYIWPVLSSLMASVATGFEVMFLWRGLTIKDYAMATESFIYLIILGAVSLIYIGVLTNRPEIFKLVEEMAKDFDFICSLPANYRYIWPVLSSLMASVATGFEVMFLWRGLTIKDYAMATESFIYLIILGAVSLIYIGVLTNRPEIFKLVEEMAKDFDFICSLPANYRKCFLDGQLLIWKLGSCWILFVSIVAVLFVSNTILILLYQSLFATMDEHTVRPLIFPVWFPHDDPHRSPNYEILIVFEIFLIFVGVSTFGLYVCILLHLLLHYYKLMDVMMIAIDELFDGLDESVVHLDLEEQSRMAVSAELGKRIGRIVQWHLSVFDAVERITSVYGAMLMYQVLFSSITICLMAFQVSNQLQQGKVNYLFALLTIGSIIQLWIPCCIGTLLRSKASSLGDRCFYSGWYATPLTRLIRQDLIIFMARTQIPVSIQFTGLPELELRTFSSIMSSAYSYFNMLRNYN